LSGSRERYRLQMLELRARQNSRAAARGLLTGIEVKELRAIKQLAIDTWGRELACIHIPRPGFLSVGYFHSRNDANKPPGLRAQTEVAVGRTHAEIAEQIRFWKGRQS
jgi:hypothetical protein